MKHHDHENCEYRLFGRCVTCEVHAATGCKLAREQYGSSTLKEIGRQYHEIHD